jgi:hypothetical protein
VIEGGILGIRGDSFGALMNDKLLICSGEYFFVLLVESLPVLVNVLPTLMGLNLLVHFTFSATAIAETVGPRFDFLNHFSSQIAIPFVKKLSRKQSMPSDQTFS